MGFLSDIAKQAGIGGTTLDVINTLENHPAYLAAGLGAVPAAAGINALFPGMALDRPGFGILDAITHPLGRGNPNLQPPSVPAIGNVVTPDLLALMDGMTLTGQTVEGLQPWHVSGYKNVASGSVIAAKSDIQDMFASAATKLFATDDTFPWTFLAQTFRCAIVTEPVDPGTEDASWDRQLFLRFVVATEVGRVSLPALGCEIVIEGPLSGSGGGTASQIFPNPGVRFPVIFEKNGTYQMFLSTDFGITLTKAISFSYQIDGWVVQNTGLLSDGKQITAALAKIMGSNPADVIAALKARQAYALQRVPLAIR